MKRTLSILVTLTVIVSLALPVGNQPAGAAELNVERGVLERATFQATFAGLMFIENVGQFPAGARFLVRGGPGPIWLAEDAIWVTVLGKPDTETQRRGDAETFTPSPNLPISASPRQGVNLRLSFVGANPHSRLEPLHRLDTIVNYYIGKDPAAWHTDVPVWGGVRYIDLYPGIDLEITDNSGAWTWRLVVHNFQFPVQDIQLRVEGAAAMAVEGDALHLTTALGEIALPLLNVERGNVERASVERIDVQTFDVHTPFAAIGNRQPSADPQSIIPKPQTPIPDLQFPFSVPDSPSDLLASTFVGGTSSDWGQAIAVGKDGSVYLTGKTDSIDIYFPSTAGVADLPVPGQAGPAAGRFTGHLFVAKFSADLKTRAYMTMLGGSYENSNWGNGDYANAIAVDDAGAVYLTGSTRSDDFAVTAGAFDTTFNGDLACGGYSPAVHCKDAFVVKLNNSGWLAYGSYLGGSGTNIPDDGRTQGDDVGEGIAVRNGIIYVAGWTTSEDFPTTAGAYKRTYANVDIGLNDDIFVAKLNPAGNGSADLLYSTFVGGGCPERATDIAVDAAGLMYVTGYAEGPSFCYFPITPGAFDNGRGNWDRDAFLFKLNPAGNGTADLLYSTFLGGAQGWDEGRGIAVDAASVVYLTGQTAAPDFPATPGAFDTVCGTDGQCNPGAFGAYADAFVSKLNPAGQGTADLLYSTFLGGSSFENTWSARSGKIALDANGEVYVTGDTRSPDFSVTMGAFRQTSAGYYDVFVSRLRLQGRGTGDLVYSTLLGGSSSEAGNAIAVASDGTVYVAGTTQSTSFPTTVGAYDTTHNGGSYDAFVARLKTVPRYLIAGQVRSRNDTPMANVLLTVGGLYTATTNSLGYYALAVPEGTYSLVANKSWYPAWSPVSRTVTVPPNLAGQDFVEPNFLKDSSPSAGSPVKYGQRITYTLRLAYPDSRTLVLYDPVPTYTTYIPGSLSAPGNVQHDADLGAMHGTLYLSAMTPVTVTYAVMVAVTATVGFAPRISNRACLYPPGGGLADCTWSNQIEHVTYAVQVFLPLVLRQ